MSRRAWKPTRLKVLENTIHKERLNPNEPQPKVVEQKPPKDLDRDARRVWRKIEPKLRQLGLLTEVDGDALGILCQIRARLVQIHKLIEGTEDMAVRTKLMADERRYNNQFRQYAKEFGLTPAGRVGLSVNTSADSDDPLGILGDE